MQSMNVKPELLTSLKTPHRPPLLHHHRLHHIYNLHMMMTGRPVSCQRRSAVFCVDLGQLGIPSCISPGPGEVRALKYGPLSMCYRSSPVSASEWAGPVGFGVKPPYRKIHTNNLPLRACCYTSYEAEELQSEARLVSQL